MHTAPIVVETGSCCHANSLVLIRPNPTYLSSSSNTVGKDAIAAQQTAIVVVSKRRKLAYAHQHDLFSLPPSAAVSANADEVRFGLIRQSVFT